MNKQSNVKVYSIPKVAEAFKCIGSACSMSCCAGWTVDLDKRTFKNYRKNVGLAKYIKKGAADGSRSSTRYGHIQNMPDGTCPMLDEKKMCNVQSILGEKALSQTCNTFPRVIHRSKNDFKITMSLACPEVVRLIVSDEKSMERTSVYNFLSEELSYVTFDIPEHFLKSDFGFKGIHDFVFSTKLPLWKIFIAISSVAKSASKSTKEKEISSKLFFEQVLLERSTQDIPCEIFQYETFAEIIFSDKFRNSNAHFQKFLLIARSNLEIGCHGLTERIKRYVIRKNLLWNNSKYSADYIWKNIYLAALDRHAHNFFPDKGLLQEKIEKITICIGLIKFLTICVLTEDDDTFMAIFTDLVAATFRELDHRPKFIEQLTDDLKSKYTSQKNLQAMIALLLK